MDTLFNALPTRVNYTLSTLNERWTNTGRTLDEHWTNTGRTLDECLKKDERLTNIGRTSDELQTDQPTTSDERPIQAYRQKWIHVEISSKHACLAGRRSGKDGGVGGQKSGEIHLPAGMASDH
ncbi:hypothetical protein HJC23_012274 [Cyclotella cryptica]|uniref:Uncharacterized protein n=1 Tax=Cyclotella cryptica TaxID=29204 RepID=A0ABD3P7P5_9STRA